MNQSCRFVVFFCVAAVLPAPVAAEGPAEKHAPATDWPRWRGEGGSAIADGFELPVRWSRDQNVSWRTTISGEGSSSPIVAGERVFVTSALEGGRRRLVHCLSRSDGNLLWSREIEDQWPEIASALTGHAAATPAADGRRVVAFFGNAGVVCYDFDGRQLWRRDFGEFESELGLASSPMLHDGAVIQVCDHDGNRFGTFDSFLIALELDSGQTRWKTDRRGLFRSWSTPIVVSAPNGGQELIVAAQDELRGYDPASGEPLWSAGGMTGWVTPSPVFAHGLVFATSGKDGPTMAVRPGGRGDVSESHVAWIERRGAPYVCSPLVYRDHLYVHNEQGVLTCRRADSGEVAYQERLGGKFTASAVAGDGKVYFTNEAGETHVVGAGEEYRLLAQNKLGGACLASPALSRGEIFIRTGDELFCIAAGER